MIYVSSGETEGDKKLIYIHIVLMKYENRQRFMLQGNVT